MSETTLAIQGTGISAVAPESDSYSVLYQLEDRSVQQTSSSDKKQSIGSTVPTVSSPLAAVRWEEGNEIRLFGLQGDHTITEFYFTEGDWKNKPVTVNGDTIKAAPTAGLAAVAIRVNNKVQARVYYQNPIDGQISELINQKGAAGWTRGTLAIKDAIPGTNLAAAAGADADGNHFAHVFYQTANLPLKDYVFGGSSWKQGEFNPNNSKVPTRTPVAALAYRKGDLKQTQIYWHSRDGVIKFARKAGTKWFPNQSTGIAADGYKFAVIQWDDGKRLRLFYQDLRGAIVVHESNDGGEKWVKGAQLAD